MADTQQGVRQQSARDAAGTTDTYDGDLRALFNAVATVPAGSTFNEAFMLWLQSVTGSSANNINDLAALYASQQIDTYNWSSVGVLLSIDFFYDPESGGGLPAGSTFTRASAAQYWDSSNLIEVGSGVIRDSHQDPVSGGIGFLPEPLATNLVPDANDLTAGSWVLLQAITPTSQGTSLFGATSYRIGPNGTSNAHRISTNIAGVFSTSLTLYVDGVAGQFLILRTGTSSTGRYSVFDLVNGTNTENSGSTPPDEVEIISLGSGKYLLLASYDANVAGNLFIAYSDTGTPGTGDPVFTGAGETYDVAAPQVEATNFPTMPVRTSGGSAARQADVLDTGVVIASEFGALLEVTLPAIIGTGNTITLLGPSATAEDILRVDDSFNVIMDDGGTPVTVGTASGSARIKLSYGRDASGRSASLNGAAVVTGGAPGAGHEGDNFQLGSANSVNQSRSTHHTTTLYEEKPTDAQLQALSS